MLLTPTILDHVVTNLPDTRASVQVLRGAVGDHQPVICSVALPRIRLKPEYREPRRWDRADWSAICLDMLLAVWEPMLPAGNVDDKLDELMLIWDTVMDRHCQTVRTRLAPPGCPWIRENPELQALMAERDAAHKDWQGFPLPSAGSPGPSRLLAAAEAVCRSVERGWQEGRHGGGTGAG